MKSIAVLLLTIALALFPLSGTRAVAAVQEHAHGVTEGHSQHGHAAGHHHGVEAGEVEATAAHSHAGVDAHGPDDSAKGSCAGDHASSSCCSLSCHAMAPHGSVGVPVQRHVTMPVGIVALPLPRGIGFDGLLRPPRPA